MAHLALYREFRPKTFDEVIGQNHIVQTLKNQIQNDSISHAYLFCGTRGTGKTSCAKIFAKAVNCQNPKNGSPCGECDVCKKIESNGNLDIVEIDAASNNRVDEIRDLREKVNYMPTVGKYKVYIIDEVHMLTDSAFNALLKTLEEPPRHIIFILATTEPEKLPATILSRCMRFDFKLVAESELVLLLSKVFASVGAKFEDKALELIATAGNGSVRDTLSVAEMCKAYSNNDITYQKVEECLGLTDSKTLMFLAEGIANKDGGSILQKIEELFALGKNMNTLLGDLCGFFKNVLMHKMANQYDLKVPETILKEYQNIADKLSEKQILDILKKLSEATATIKFCTNDKVFVQTTLLGLFYDDNLEIEILKQKVQNLEAILSGKKTTQNFNQTQVSHSVNDNNSQINNTVNIQQNLTNNGLNKQNDNPFDKIENKSQSNAENKMLGEIISFARQSGEMILYAGLADVQNVQVENGNLVFKCKTESLRKLVEDNKVLLSNFVKEKFGLSGVVATLEVDKEKEFANKLSNLLDGKVTFK